MPSAGVIKIAILGAGHMGRACAQSLEHSDLLRKSKITFVVRTITAMPKTPKQSNWEYSLEVPQDVDLIFLAVKPIDFLKVESKFDDLSKAPLIVSLMAGIPIATVQQHFSASKVVRFMTNLAIARGTGVGCYYLNDQLSEQEQVLLEVITTAFGCCERVSCEDQLDAATALVGSLPAVLFYFLEQVQQAGVNLGFDRSVSEKLVRAVACSALGQIQDPAKTSFSELISQISSKGGTTEALLEHLRPDFGRLVSEGLQVAAKKSADLGKFT